MNILWLRKRLSCGTLCFSSLWLWYFYLANSIRQQPSFKALSQFMFFPAPVSNSAPSTRLPTTEHQNDNIFKDNPQVWLCSWGGGWVLGCIQVRHRGFYLLICTLIFLTFTMEAWDSTTAWGLPTENFYKSCLMNNLCVTLCKEICGDDRGVGRG